MLRTEGLFPIPLALSTGKKVSPPLFLCSLPIFYKPSFEIFLSSNPNLLVPFLPTLPLPPPASLAEPYTLFVWRQRRFFPVPNSQDALVHRLPAIAPLPLLDSLIDLPSFSIRFDWAASGCRVACFPQVNSDKFP